MSTSYPIPDSLTNSSIPMRPQSLAKIDRMRNINAIGVKRVGNLGFGVRFNPNFYWTDNLFPKYILYSILKLDIENQIWIRKALKNEQFR